MFYVTKADDGRLCMVETILIERRGTWHYWKDLGRDYQWRTRGPGLVRSGRINALHAYLAGNPEDASDVVLLAWADSYYDGERVGLERGKEYGRQAMRQECSMGCCPHKSQPKPKLRSFLRRLWERCPLSVA